MTRRQALNRARELLASHKIEDASLEAEILLRHTLKIDRVQFYTEPDCKLTNQQGETYWQLIERRIKGEPSAYIIGHREFFGLDFYVDRNVLIPRPETELLVEQAIAYSAKYTNPKIVDVGTGCGAIAISLAIHLPQARIYAIDISEAALKIASRNCRIHHVEERVKLILSDLLENIPAQIDIIVANLPYVTTSDLSQVNTSGYEPALALNGGADGLDVVRRLCLQVKNKLHPNGCLLMEIGMGLAKTTAEFLKKLYPSVSIDLISDMAGIERIIRMTLPV
jgi:release factor glutamine methyltransferase